jgi:hypothetical protein
LDKKIIQPAQPIIIDKYGVERFQENAIVQFLLNNGPFNINDLLIFHSFSKSDHVQFCQLTGMSLQLFADQEFVNNEEYDRCTARYNEDESGMKMKWEYVEIDIDVDDYLCRLNEMGKEGWELIATTPKNRAVLKRRVDASNQYSYETCESGYVIYGPDNNKINPWELTKILNRLA